jgi:hypothetical protein
MWLSSLDVRFGSRNLGDGDSWGVESEKERDLDGVLSAVLMVSWESEAEAACLSSWAMPEATVDRSLANRLSIMAPTEGGGPAMSGIMVMEFSRNRRVLLA